MLCLRVSPKSRLSLKVSLSIPVEILCQLRLLHHGVKVELHIVKKEFPLAVCGTNKEDQW